MFTRNIKNTFTQGLLNAVSGVLGEAKKKCSEDCECEACAPEEDETDETNEGYVSHAQRKAVWANRSDDGKGHPDKKKKMKEEVDVEEMVNEAAEGLADKAKKSGVSLSVLKKVYSRGIAAWNTGHRPGTTPQQWAHARVNSYISKGKGTYHGADKDLRSEGYEDRKEAGKLGNQLKREHEVKEKKEPNGVKEAKEDVPFKGPYKKTGEERKDEYGNKVKNVAKYLAKKAMNTQKEEVNQIDELSTKTLEKYKNAARADAYDADTVDDDPRFRKRAKGITTATKKIRSNFVKGVDEAFEQIDELSKGTMGRYINKAATKMGSQGVTAGLKIAADEKSSKNFKDMGKREKGIKLAVNKLTKEEQDFVDSLNNDMFEEVEITEARGRPRKAGAKDFTIHPKTKEKLMHNNPEHMKKLSLIHI